jgi:outer membrane protein assembly factor BamD (BamD/ComL family)
VLPGSRVLAALLLSAATTAPIQCASKPKPEQRLEEEPAEALYNLAERFKKLGNQPAQAETLRTIVERYPVSRFAEAARLDLEQMGGAPKR